MGLMTFLIIQVSAEYMSDFLFNFIPKEILKCCKSKVIAERK